MPGSSEPTVPFHVPRSFIRRSSLIRRASIDGTAAAAPVVPETERIGVNHTKLVCLVGRYSSATASANEEDVWMRKSALSVLIYEGCVGGLLDYDYAPRSLLLPTTASSARRIWMNLSQDGNAACDDLVEAGILQTLKRCTDVSLPVSALQVTSKGQSFLEQVPAALRAEVDRFLCIERGAGAGGLAGRLQVSFDHAQSAFILHNELGVRRVSAVTETEDVSYVSSPYLPACLRIKAKGGGGGGVGRSVTPLSSNAHRAHECGSGSHSIANGELSEAIVLGDVNAMVAEFIPFGANQIVALNERLGALDRCQGGLFSNMVDRRPTDSKFSLETGLTKIHILDFDFVRFANFETHVSLPEDAGVVQIESFGMHVSGQGTLLYGMHVDAIIDRLGHAVSLDHLSRLLVDVHMDSSTIIDDLIAPLQRHMMDVVFLGDVAQRNKFNLITAAAITPRLPAAQYMDRAERENELKQVLGDILQCIDISEADVLIIGKEGTLLAGPSSKDFEATLVTYTALQSYHLFLSNLCVRIFVLDDLMHGTERHIAEWRHDPTTVNVIRGAIKEISADLIVLEQVLAYVQESLEEFRLPTAAAGAAGVGTAADAAAFGGVGARLLEVLRLEQAYADAIMRCKDMAKLLGAARSKLETLQFSSSLISKDMLELITKNIQSNFEALAAASAAEERASASYELMQQIFSGSLAFSIVDRVDGNELLGSRGVDIADNAVGEWVNAYLRNPIAAIPGLWLFLNIGWLFLFTHAVRSLLDYMNDKNRGAMYYHQHMARKIDVAAMEAFLQRRDVETRSVITNGALRHTKVMWYEKDRGYWHGQEPPKITIEYDPGRGWLLSAKFNWNAQRNSMDGAQILELFVRLLSSHSIIVAAQDGASADGAEDDDNEHGMRHGLDVAAVRGEGDADRAGDAGDKDGVSVAPEQTIPAPLDGTAAATAAERPPPEASDM
jgi:WD repeat-containing protein 35